VIADLPALGRGSVLLALGVPREELLAAVYHRPPWRSMHLALHGAPVAAAAAVAARRSPAARSVCAGWAAHLAVDYVSHHTDAWPALWPVSGRHWSAPVSYWEPDHGARTWSAAETAALAAAAVSDDSRAGRVLGAAAALLAAGPLLAGRRSVWGALGARPDPPPGR
jgi:hypothetical protein